MMPVQPMGYYNPVAIEAKKAADLGLMLGILAFFVMGVILGPIAIYYGLKARRLDPSLGLGGIVCGSIALIANLSIYIIFFSLMMMSPFY